MTRYLFYVVVPPLKRAVAGVYEANSEADGLAMFHRDTNNAHAFGRDEVGVSVLRKSPLQQAIGVVSAIYKNVFSTGICNVSIFHHWGEEEGINPAEGFAEFVEQSAEQEWWSNHPAELAHMDFAGLVFVDIFHLEEGKLGLASHLQTVLIPRPTQ